MKFKSGNERIDVLIRMDSCDYGGAEGARDKIRKKFQVI